MSMFKRANATFEAKNNTIKGPLQPQVPLAKQLFPSSSPTPRHDANIKDQFQRRVNSSSGPPGLSQPSDRASPLDSRSSNSTQPSRPAQPANRFAANSKPFASLYNNRENSFKQDPDFIDLTGDDARTSTMQGRGRSVADVDFFEDDFSDDENLDLDFQCPSALPTLPSLPTNTAMPPPRHQPTPAKQDIDAPADDDTSVISWSQSSPSHHQPSHSMSISQSTNSTASAKRMAPEDHSAAGQPVAKKRTMPIQYHQYKTLRDSLAAPATQATPAAKPKSKEPLTWDLTPGAVKAQQKMLKGKGKKSAVSEPGLETNDKQQAVKSQMVKQSAIALSKEQETVKELVCGKNKSVFFTGPAGTGKSVLMRAIIAQLKNKFKREPDRLAITASTGLAACNIGGMTLHSFSGIGLGKDDVPTLVRKIRRNPKAKNRWLRAKVLVIDEISMVDGDLFDKLSQVGRTLRNNGRPWGGIQLVITGDFFQLPPVPDRDSRETKFAFDAATWNTSIDHTIGLTEVFRQKDPVFATMLNEMRLGRISEQTVKTFKSMSRPLQFNDGLEVTELFPTRNEVENSNQRRLRELPGEIHRYDALDAGDPAIREKLLSNMMAPKTLELKKGAQVMLIKNMDETLVNGSLGTVIGFSTESAFEISGGSTADDEHGSDEPIDRDVKKRFAAFSRELDRNAGPDQKKWPLVQFHAVDGSSRTLLCISEPWKVETPTGEVQASREQLPLILAWALSIHKAQGQTLARVKVDLGKVFEKGQAYVALSRAVTQDGLQVLRFDKQKVMAHPRVITFYGQLYSADAAAKTKKQQSLHALNPAAKGLTHFGAEARSKHPMKKLPSLQPTFPDDLDDEEEAMASYAHAY